MFYSSSPRDRYSKNPFWLTKSKIKKKKWLVLFYNIEASVAQWLACWTIVPKIVGSNPAEAFGFFLCVKKSFSMPSFRMGK